MTDADAGDAAAGGEGAAGDGPPAGAVEWRPWTAETLAAARDADRPLLLSLVTPWCRECAQMDAGAYADPGVRERLHDAVVPVRADADRHPRLRERYAVGGFPSTVFCTPDGDVIAGATAMAADGLRQVIDRVAETYAAEGADAGRVPRALRAGAPPSGDASAVEPAMAEVLEHAFDGRNAGWGTDAKFPLPQAVAFGLKRDRGHAVATLDAALAGLQDDDGGVFRYATERDWTGPRRAKLLDANAAVLRVVAHAYCYTGSERFREAADDVVDYLTGTLWTGDGFGASQAPPGLDAPPAIPDRPAAATTGDVPPVDATVLADRNALAADALCHLTAYTDDERVRRYAERTLDAVAGLVVGGGGDSDVGDGAATASRPGLVAHHAGTDPAATGVLADQAAVVRAFATAASVLGPHDGPTVETAVGEAAGREPAVGHLAVARLVADATLEELREGPACVDGPAVGPGLLDRTLYPVGGNAVLADALVDLAALADEPAYAEAARDLVAAFAGAADRLEPSLAGYGTAAGRAVGDPLRIDVAAPAGADLHRAALRVADHEKVVVPDAGTLLDADRAPVPGSAVVSGPGGTATARTPQALLDVVGDVV